jgi:haloalkane dehalogenase
MSTIPFVRTPDSRFVDLPGWPYQPRYTEIDGLRIHHVDEGPSDGPVVLLMHGEPTWAYLYRKMIPILTASGIRCIAPDLVGFGRSDKPTNQSDYSYARIVSWMTGWFDSLELRDVTFFGQDWGGLIGLRIVANRPDHFARVVISNTGLPTGDRPPTDAFLAWQKFTQTTDVFPVGTIVEGGSATKPLGADVVAAYDAPFHEEAAKAGARILPSLVPTSTDDPAAADNRAAWEIFAAWTKPFVCCFSDQDAVTKGGERAFLKLVPALAGQENHTIVGGGHFVQEDRPQELCEVILSTMRVG